jgi:two-component system, sensor histidine kinase and response regulator
MTALIAQEPPVNILLVDDKKENLLALESILEAPGYHLVRALNGQEALLALLAQEYAAIVLDVQMPGMTGIELAQFVRGRKKTQHIPIVLLTAHGDQSAAAGYQAGAVDFLIKPVQPAVLRSKVAVFAELFRKRSALIAEVEERRQAEERIGHLNQELSKRVDQLAAANAELEAFSYAVSHDLRAPLRHIGGFVDMLREECGPDMNDVGQRYLGIIAESAIEMGMLIDNLLAFSRLGRTEMRQTLVDMEDLVQEVLREMASDMQSRHIEWEIRPLPKVHGDRSMLKQVWVNLLSNAVKYTGPRVPARIAVGHTERHGEWEFYVRDNGVGFDMRHASKLFGVFQRLHVAEEFEGTGIGLANVQRTVGRHGGRAWAEGKVDEGATFYFKLPRFMEKSP